MEYIYDILLNFQDEYYDFFEWIDNDKVINVKKIPLYKLSNKDYLCLKFHDVILKDNPFIKKTKMVIVTNGIEVMGILLDNNNKVIKRSSLLIDEADDILDGVSRLKNTILEFDKNVYKTHKYEGRLYKERTKYIDNFFKNMNKDEEEYLLKYLYLDIYKEEENDLDKILSKLKKCDINKLYNCLVSLKN